MVELKAKVCAREAKTSVGVRWHPDRARGVRRMIIWSPHCPGEPALYSMWLTHPSSRNYSEDHNYTVKKEVFVGPLCSCLLLFLHKRYYSVWDWSMGCVSGNDFAFFLIYCSTFGCEKCDTLCRLPASLLIPNIQLRAFTLALFTAVSPVVLESNTHIL